MLDLQKNSWMPSRVGARVIDGNVCHANESVFIVFVAMVVLLTPVALVAPSFTLFVSIPIPVERGRFSIDHLWWYVDHWWRGLVNGHGVLR